MQGTPCGKIQKWFADHDDGEFVYDPLGLVYSVIAPPNQTAPIIYSTKPSAVAAAIRHPANAARVGMIGRYGFPSDRDVAWIRDIAAPNQLFFIGDLDPVDLLIYASLRLRLHPQSIHHLGVNDAYLEALEIELPPNYHIQLSGSERASLDLLNEVFPDCRRIIGSVCAAKLDRLQKIELEAVVSSLGSTSSLLRPIVERGQSDQEA